MGRTPHAATSVRSAALDILLAVERGRTTLATEIDRARRTLDDERDRALLIELTAGSLRWQARLDALLDRCSNRPVETLDPRVRIILRLSGYQLEHLDRVPAHAVIHQAVELCRTAGQPRAAGFVNAVLRTFQRRRATLTLPGRPGAGSSVAEQVAYLSTSLSHPAWLVERWIARHGFEAAERWCDYNNQIPELTVRASSRHTTDELLADLKAAGVGASRGRWVTEAIRLAPGAMSRVPARVREAISLQDEASQIVPLVAGVRPGDRVIDLCAAPGGKTVLLSQALGGRGQLVASDRRPARVRLLRTTLERAGVRANLVVLDAATALPFGATFDRVLLDAPCSGLGTLRRDPDLKWTRRPEDLDRLAVSERVMLDVAADIVRPGGSITYSTCSSEPEENDRVVDAFLSAHPQFSLARARPAGVATGEALVDGRGFLRTLPFEHGLDAFFAAVLVRQVAA